MTQTRTRIVSAANRIVSRDGAAHLTLDAVAEEAQLSKGGLLYHFPSKKALIQGMLDALMDQVETRRDEIAANLTGNNPALRGYILAAEETISAERGSILAILAAAAEDPTLLTAASTRFSGWIEETMAAASDPLRALQLVLAVEGLRFMETLSLLDLSEERRTALRQRVLEEAAE